MVPRLHVTHVNLAVEQILVPGEKFQPAHLDLVGPLPVSATGQGYIITIINRTFRRSEAVPFASNMAEKCGDTYVVQRVAHYGVPQVVTMDRGTQFASAKWVCLSRT
jgi:hypothetical protein